MKKKLLAILLTVCMVISMAPAALATGSVFTDVDADDWFAEEVEYVYDNGLMNGVGDNKFDPNGNVTRAMMWITLARLAGEDTSSSDSWWLAGQQWAVENEISDGTMAADNITREQMVTMLWRYAQNIGLDVSVGENTNILSYTDALSINEWAISAMQWACGAGIIKGMGDGSLAPQGYATRAQLAAILYRFAEEVLPGVNEPGEEEPSDPPVYVHYHSYSDWTHNGDGTHSRSCSCGDTQTEACTFEYIDNEDGTHTEFCSDCDYEKTTVHTYTDDKCVCGNEITVDNGEMEPVAVIGTTGYATLDDALTAAVAGDIVVLMQDIEATAQISIEKAITLNGNGKTIKANNAEWPTDGHVKMLMSINGTSDVTVANLTLDSNGQAYGLQAYESTNVILEGVTTQNSKGAGLTVNDSTVTATDLTASGNTWGSVNVDKGSPKFTLNSGTLSDALQIWSELKDASVVTAEGYYTVDGGTVYIWTNDTTGLAAKIGDLYYQTLEAALATVTDSEPVEIEILETGSAPLTTNFAIPGGRNITLRGATGNAADVVLQGQIATTSSTAGTLTIKDVTILVNDKIVDKTGISQTGSSAIALWGNQTVSCENVVFDMSLSDSSAITGWWDTGVGTTIIVKDCTFNCNGQRPIRTCGNVTVENCTFNDPYRYAVQLTAKADTATEMVQAVVNFKNNTINNGASGKAFVYGIQLEGADYGCHDLIINGEGNTINAGEWDTSDESTMYYCECGKVDHATITWNTEVSPVHEDPEFVPVAKIGGVEYASLQDALDAVKDGETITLIADIETEAATANPYGGCYAFKMDGGILDGDGYYLTMECNGDHWGIMTSGGTIKNLTIEEGCRAIMIYSPTEDIILDNVNIGGDGVLYPINTGEHATVEGVDLIVSNSTLKGWTSFAGIESASFTNCTFGQGTYYNNIYGRVVKPYVKTSFTDCSFIEHMNLDLSALANGQKVTIDNCTVNGQPVTVGVFTVNPTDEQYDTELFTVDLPSWATSLADCLIIDGKIPVAEGFVQDPESGEYEITSAAGLFNFAKMVNESGNNFSGKTVKLTADIDLNNAAWTPIGQTGATEFKGVFDGQNYTISNLNIDSSAETGAYYSSGLFGWIESHAQDITIKNVKVDGATVIGHHNVAVIAGYLEGDSVVENCHVSNATLDNTKANDDADGDKTGVIAGYAAGEVRITGCSATDCTVSSGRDAGQIVGAAPSVVVVNCTATNVTVTANGTGTGANINEALIGRVLD